ncbi:MAG TPA: methyl-accepting chemotaxis protein [Gammaproteobacteria bacterium]
MQTSSSWHKLLPPLGVVLALTLAAAAGVLWLASSPAGSRDAEVGRLVAEAQAARLAARAAVAGEAGAFEAAADSRSRIEAQRASLASAELSSAARALVASDAWQAVDSALVLLTDGRATLEGVHGARARLAELAPELLEAVGNAVASLPAAGIAQNEPHLDRLQLAVEGLRQDARALGLRGEVADIVQRFRGAEEYIGQFVRGLEGADQSLGLVPVTAPDASASVAQAAAAHEAIRTAIGTVSSGAALLATAVTAVGELDAAAARLLEAYRGASLPAAGGGAPFGGWLPAALLGAAAALVLIMLLIHVNSREAAKAARLHAEQNERNQHAILRLLDELSSLADGDLTVQATVTEDITGAIADSINYAIEALRGLVTTMNETSIQVDAAAKQTENSAKQLLRSAEMQAKQAAAASESMARMAMSIEEVSGNAERASDVARHAVDVAHKGGEAVRRTIEGMNTIRETIQDTSKRIKRLGESSQEIGNIVELIEEIAEQTNILALNASIEASRAGEASRGFAVVADEVQKLAERSANATKKIEVLVSTIQSDTNEAVVSMERSTTDVVGGALLAENAGAALDEIEQVSHQIASLVQNISSSARNQATVATAITKNMQVLREISAKTTESTAVTSEAISKLAALAAELRRTVAGFRLPEPGTTSGVLTPARVAESLELRKLEELPPAEAPPAAVVERRRQSG